jgi:hypothetical protein
VYIEPPVDLPGFEDWGDVPDIAIRTTDKGFQVAVRDNVSPKVLDLLAPWVCDAVQTELNLYRTGAYRTE